MPYFSHDDIAQIGTPPGHGTVGAIRISGPGAFAILARASEGLEDIAAAAPHRQTRVCRLKIGLAGRSRHDAAPVRSVRLCPARAYLMPGPASYTREDVAEVHLPGAPVLLQAALAALIRVGARAAAPGEFTFRAFRNGRLSLGQAEAVEEVIRAADASDRRRALSRLGDRSRERIEGWRDQAMHLAARVEAALDFSEEELEADLGRDLAAMADELAREGGVMSRPAATVQELPQIALVGNANAGKSSLFNALVEEDATLVSPRAATTRDSLRRRVRWEEVDFILSDNPGFLPNGEGAGGEASDKAFRRLGGEDAACWVVDGSRALDARDGEFARALSGKIVIAVNKADLPAIIRPEDAAALAAEAGVNVAGCLAVSAVAGQGTAELRRMLAEAAREAAASGQWNRRETLELGRALESLGAARDELRGACRLELAAEDLRAAVAAFALALGDGYAEEALQRIFSSFCIGK